MNYYDRILRMAEKNNGYVIAKEVAEAGINRMFLTNMVKEGKLVRLARGYYGTLDYIKDDYYKIALKSKNARFSFATALYLHDLSDRVPLVYHVTVPYEYSGILQKEENVIIHFVKRELLNLGVMDMISPFGVNIKVYDAERTICDIIKYRNKVDVEIFSKALKEYAKCKNKRLANLVTYAGIMNIEEKVRAYMEVLL